MQTISLADLTHGQTRNLTGHERGLAAREAFGMDNLDASADPVDVLIPAELDSLTTSFFQGMFAKSVRRFETNDGFFEHYRFFAGPTILRQIQRGLDAVRMRRGEISAL